MKSKADSSRVRLEPFDEGRGEEWVACRCFFYSSLLNNGLLNVALLLFWFEITQRSKANSPVFSAKFEANS